MSWAMPSLEPRAQGSVPVWIRWGWSRSFEIKRLCWHVLVVGPVSVGSAMWGHPWWSFAVLFVGFWPFPYRARWTGAGLEVRWLFVRECLALEDIEDARIRSGGRYLGIARREDVLDIELRTDRLATVMAHRSILDGLQSQITGALSARRS